MVLGPTSQARGALGKNTLIKVWRLEGIGGRHKRKSRFHLVEGPAFKSASTAEPGSQKGKRMKGGGWGEVQILGGPLDR